ncbi:Mrr restriction system protein [Pediococcus damnosus]|uniref:Mrr restriction system protein n=1 Tax=Pediococcus damnosus TaxID=51663 RepID=A0A0R2HJL7_9LACO|nr:restriction endonuclease [Pediococcus damnosus]AMV63274.1 Mrr restriction system protein [Pediococcus damnosus]AMV66830.1 Mrr restriction system protein [Pediococcus damnosus]KJU74187.1 restriction endonuclease [Pediococcus damnosus LMG 28219]KRN53200.1 restriction endonuclease [Pediococcus damnosus]PJE48961.1 Mrr restriction system protein [Pediococcus damnosus]
MKFKQASQKEREEMLFPIILKALKKLGGQSNINDLKKEIALYSDDLGEFTTFEKMSRGNNLYRPFDYVFNFAVASLGFADFLYHPERGVIELTEKGRTFDFDKLDVERDIRKLANPKWDERKQQKKNKIKASEKDIDNTDAEIEDEPEADWKGDLAQSLNAFTPAKFELFARLLVKKMGVELDETLGTKLTGDGGIDGFGYLTTGDFRTARVAIQAKRWNGAVSSPEIDKFRGAMDKYNAEYGIFITTSDYTKDAIRASRVGTRVITLINGDKIADLVSKLGIHAKPVTTYVLDDFYSSNN